jgi:hypothetical protein
MHQVKDEIIKNKKVRAMFGNIDKVCDFAMRRRLDCIAHMLHQEDKKLMKKLLTCWICCARVSGGQQSSLKDSTFDVINLLLISNNLKVVKYCPTLSWTKEALNPLKWKALMKKTKYIGPKQNRTKGRTKKQAPHQRTN